MQKTLAQKFGVCKAGALSRFNAEADKVATALAADIAVIASKIEEEGLKASNVALFKTKSERLMRPANGEAKELLRIIEEEYLDEIRRLVHDFGGEYVEDGRKAKFRDGSIGSVPKSLFFRDPKTFTLTK